MKTTIMKKVFFISASLLFTAVCFAQNATSTTSVKSLTTADSKEIKTAANATSATTVSADATPAVDKANESLTNARQRTKKARKRATQEVAEKRNDVKHQLDNTNVDAGVNVETSARSTGSAAGTKTAIRVNSQAMVPASAIKTPAVCIKPIRAGLTGNAGLNINK